MKHAVLALTLILTPLPALAHKVIAGVFPSGTAIEGEIGFSNGDMATEQEVIVTGPDGTELGRTTTDGDGFFLYTPRAAIAHHFHADLGGGHVADVVMSAKDVAKIMGVSPESAAVSTPAAAPSSGPQADTSAPLSESDRARIAEMIRDEIRPLRREMAATREHHDLQSILGGIGYILGLFGLGFYLAARRRLTA